MIVEAVTNKRIEFSLDFMTADEAVQSCPDYEVKRILREVAAKICTDCEDDTQEGAIYDENGNKIGRFYYEVISEEH